MVNAANLVMFLGVLFAVVPAMALLYRLLNRFEGFFDEKRLFKFLMVGMLVGAAVTLVEVVALNFHDPFRLQTFNLQFGLGALVATYPLMEGLAKTASLNWHTLAGRRDTPYYGVSFGLGFGAILTFIVVARTYQNLLVSPGFALLSHVELVTTSVLLFILFVGGIMLHAVGGVLVGRATGDRDPLKAFGYGVVTAIPFYLGYYFFWAATDPVQRFVAPVGTLMVGVWAMRRFAFKTLEEIVPEDLAKQVRREVRKRSREGE